MGSPLGPLMANAFMCKIEKQLETRTKLPIFYKCYVDDTLSTMPDPEAASEFLTTLNESHPSIDFTMALEENGWLPFLRMNVIRSGCCLDTTIYRKPTDTGLFLHYHSHVNARYKRLLLNTMLNGAFQLSSTWKFFTRNANALKRSSPDCAILTTLCSHPFANSLNQKCRRIHIPKWLLKGKSQSESCCPTKTRNLLM